MAIGVRGVVKRDGALVYDEDGGWGEDDLKVVIMLDVSNTVEVGVPVSLPIVDQCLVIECYDVTTRAVSME